MRDFEPITGRIHQPPPVHQVFEGWNFVICNFVPRKVDYHPLAIPVPYYHSNVDSDEIMFYVDGDYEARKGSGIGKGSISVHPGGHAHGPQPGATEGSLGVERFDELAVMVDTFRPLELGEGGLRRRRRALRDVLVPGPGPARTTGGARTRRVDRCAGRQQRRARSRRRRSTAASGSSNPLRRRGDSTGLTITELAAALGVGRPVVYRLVTTLEAHHLVARAADGRVRLALGISRLASAVTPIVRAEARPVLRELADAVGATAHLTIAEGDEALALVVVEPSWTDFHVAYRSGARHRLDQGAAGRAILAGRAGESWPRLVGWRAAGRRPRTRRADRAGGHLIVTALEVDGVGGVDAVGRPAVEASVGVDVLQPLQTPP